MQCGCNKVDSPGHRPASTLHLQFYQNLLFQMRMALPDCHLAPKDTLCTFAVLDTREAKPSAQASWNDLSVFRLVRLQVTLTIYPSLVCHSFSPTLWLICVGTSSLKEGLFFPNSWNTSGRKGGEGKWALRSPLGLGARVKPHWKQNRKPGRW